MEIFLFLYLGINAFLTIGMVCCCGDTGSIFIYPDLIYALRETYNLNKIGVGIVIILVTILCLPSIVCSAVILTLMFCILKLSRIFCKIFRRKDNDPIETDTDDKKYILILDDNGEFVTYDDEKCQFITVTNIEMVGPKDIHNSLKDAIDRADYAGSDFITALFRVEEIVDYDTDEPKFNLIQYINYMGA